MFCGSTARIRATRSCLSKHHSLRLLQTYRSSQCSPPSWSPRVLCRRFSLRAGLRRHALPSAPSVLTLHLRRRSGSARAQTSTATNTEERVPAASPAVVSALRTTLVLWTRGCQVQPWWKLWTLHWRGITGRKRRVCSSKVNFSKQEPRSISVENRVLRIGGAHRAPLFIDVSKQVRRSIFDECVRA